MSTACGGNLGDLHADFLLSFVPNICIHHLPPAPQGHGYIRDTDLKSARPVEEDHKVVGHPPDLSQAAGGHGDFGKGETHDGSGQKSEENPHQDKPAPNAADGGQEGEGDRQRGNGGTSNVITPQEPANHEGTSRSRDDALSPQVCWDCCGEHDH